MRGMGNDYDPNTTIDWSIVRQIWPYLTEFKTRVGMPFVSVSVGLLWAYGIKRRGRNVMQGANYE